MSTGASVDGFDSETVAVTVVLMFMETVGIKVLFERESR